MELDEVTSQDYSEDRVHPCQTRVGSLSFSLALCPCIKWVRFHMHQNHVLICCWTACGWQETWCKDKAGPWEAYAVFGWSGKASPTRTVCLNQDVSEVRPKYGRSQDCKRMSVCDFTLIFFGTMTRMSKYILGGVQGKWRHLSSPRPVFSITF